MAVSSTTKNRIHSAVRTPEARDEIVTMLNSALSTPAAAVAAIGATANLVAPAVIGDAAPLAGTESRLDVIEAKVDALIAALKTAGLMST